MPFIVAVPHTTADRTPVRPLARVPRRAVALLVATAAALGLAAPSIASAAVTSGSVTDPRDAVVDPSTKQVPPDVKAMRATYDDVAGKVTVAVDLWPGESRPWTLDASLGVPGTNGCTEGQRDVRFYVDQDYAEASLTLKPSSASPTVVWGTFGGDFATHYEFSFANKSLAGLGVRCFSAVALDSWGVKDRVASFCLGTAKCFRDTTPPSVAWVTPAANAVVSGILTESTRTCLVNASDASGIDHTENFVDGKLHDVQRTAPWSCDIDTRTLSNGPHTLMVRAYDKAGNRADASISVTVRNGTVAVASRRS